MKLEEKHKLLLLVDGWVNVILGIIILFFPLGIIEMLGLPAVGNYFYTSILGAVILGIGVALLIELSGSDRITKGLGLSMSL